MNDAVTIGMAATAVGTVLWFLVKMMIDDFKQSVSGVGSKLDSTCLLYTSDAADE